MAHVLPALPYAFDALEPHIDARTMELHHDKHHATYVAKLNEALAKHPELESANLTALLSDLASVPEDIRGAVRNHAGGHLNHELYWNTMSAKGGGEAGGALGAAITAKWGGFAAFKDALTTATVNTFGSGWGWLAVKDGELVIASLPNQDSMLSQGATPLVGCDVWEHAYYLKYQNLRPKYVEAWFNVVDWSVVDELYKAATA